MRAWGLIPAILLLAVVGSVISQNVVCGPKTTKHKVKVSKGSSFSLVTQAGNKYGKKVKCLVTIQRTPRGKKKCQNVNFSCTEFDVNNCKRGDKMVADGKKYCQSPGPNITSKKKKMKVNFISGRKSQGGTGAVCTIQCLNNNQLTTPPPTTTPPPPTTTAVSNTTGPGTGSHAGYSQAWLRGEGPAAHVHEGIQLADRSGWVGIGELLPEEEVSAQTFKIMVRSVDNNANTLWTKQIGDDHQQASKSSYSVGYSIIQDGGLLIAGIGLWQKSTNIQAPAVVALDVSTGAIQWTTVLAAGQPGHGGVRSCIMDSGEIVCAGYVKFAEPGFMFVADEGTPAVWRLDTSGQLIQETFLSIEGVGQVAKVRKDATSGLVLCSTGWGVLGGQDVNVVAVVKISTSFVIEWSQTYGVAGGNSQVFDMRVDNDGNYILGGHTTVGTGVVNWDYLALKVNSQTQAVMWRNTYGQPRGFDARYIHDEMYGVDIDNDGNYLLLGGSGDEYSYSAMGSGAWSGWSSDTWGSYLVIVSSAGETLYENFYGSKGGNNAGEWLSYDKTSGDIMVYTDSDTAGGFGFLKLTPNA